MYVTIINSLLNKIQIKVVCIFDAEALQSLNVLKKTFAFEMRIQHLNGRNSTT
jgi:hypothetical protein